MFDELEELKASSEGNALKGVEELKFLQEALLASNDETMRLSTRLAEVEESVKKSKDENHTLSFENANMSEDLQDMMMEVAECVEWLAAAGIYFR